MKLKELENKKIVILGFGREGRDTLSFLKKYVPSSEIKIVDPNKERDYAKKLNDCNLIIKSPGIPFKVLSQKALKKITTQTEIFLQNCPSAVVGVTGTKGKSTTASLIYGVLKKGGVKAHLVGNIGKPALSLLPRLKPDSAVVYEMSSFQLTNLKISPKIAVLLNIYKEHLDYYRSFSEYVAAKSNITKHQRPSDYLIYNSKDSRVKDIAKKSRAKKISIEGKYYQLNMEAARRVGEIFKIPSQKIETAIKSFKPLPHRLEYVGKFKGVEFYNDSLSTIPEATMEALDYLGGKVQTLIAGGYDRGLDFEKLAERISRSKVETLILFPKTGEKIWGSLKDKKSNIVRHFFTSSMEEAVRLGYKYTKSGKVCLLSPSSPSFGIFKDYAERGEAFKKFVKKFKNAKIEA
jgi:UDP-N-acetylmuramoyl-L-alanine---L-glutamate ligase